MNRKSISRVIAIVLLLAIIGTTASAATLSKLLSYAKSKGFTVKTTTTSVTKPTIKYTETYEGKDKLVWTNKAKQQFTITASKGNSKEKLQKLHLYMLQNYKNWTTCKYVLNGSIKYAYNYKKAKKVYGSLASYRKGVKNYTAKSTGSTVYILNNNTMKFHLTTCNDASRIKPENKQTVKDTRDNLISRQYVPCKKCNP